MNFFKVYTLLWCVLIFSCRYATAQIVVTALSESITVDFDTSTPGVCDGPIKGTGFTADPATGSGMLDSDAISFSGLVNPVSMDFGGTATTGDAARGIASNGDNGSGFYAFEPTNGTGRAFGFQPSATHFNPGTVTIQFTNQTGSDFNEFSFSLDVYLKNDSDRSTSYSFGLSTDGVNYVSQPGFSTSIVPGFLGSGWLGPNSFLIGSQLSITQDVCAPEPILDGNSVFVRFEIVDDGNGTDVGGDEIAFDNINFTVGDRAFCAATDVTNPQFSRSPNGSSVDLSWENPSGCYDEIVVVARATNPVTANISDDTIDGLTLGNIDPNTNVDADWSARGTDNEVFTVSEEQVGTANEDYFVYKGTGTSTTITGLDPNIEYYFRILAVSSGCDWAVGENIFTNMPLATQLINFEAESAIEGILLNWELVSDNDQQLVIERSFDGQQFAAIASIFSTIANTNTSPTYYDTQPLNGINYYRLKIINEDGAILYSPIRAVAYFDFSKVQLIPVTEEGKLQITHLPADQNLSYEIYNRNGQVVKTGQLAPELSLPPLDAGIYYFSVLGWETRSFLWMK